MGAGGKCQLTALKFNFNIYARQSHNALLMREKQDVGSSFAVPVSSLLVPSMPLEWSLMLLSTVLLILGGMLCPQRMPETQRAPDIMT